MAFQWSSCREAIYKSLLWAFDLGWGVFGSHTCFKAHTTSKGVFSLSQHYASSGDLGHGTQPKTKVDVFEMDEMEYSMFINSFDHICEYSVLSLTSFP